MLLLWSLTFSFNFFKLNFQSTYGLQNVLHIPPDQQHLRCQHHTLRNFTAQKLHNYICDTNLPFQPFASAVSD